jgi:hypothetical protein
MKQELRNYERTSIPDDRLLPCAASSGELRGHVSVLGVGGAFIRTRDLLPVGTALILRIDGHGEVLTIPCVVRDVQPGGVGVSFSRLPAQQKEHLKKILARLKE